MYTHQVPVLLMTLAQKRGHKQWCKWNLKTLLHIFTNAAWPAIWKHQTCRAPFFKEAKVHAEIEALKGFRTVTGMKS